MKRRKYLPNQHREPFVSTEYQKSLDQQEYLRRAALPHYRSFDAYVADHPNGELYRRWITNDGRRTDVLFVPGDGFHTGIPGDYLWVTYHEYNGTWSLILHDCDDGSLQRDVATREDVEKELQQLIELAPFHFSDLYSFGWYIP